MGMYVATLTGGPACRHIGATQGAGKEHASLQCLALVQGDAIVQSPPVASFNAKDWAAAFSSQPGEFDYWIDEVEGTIPEFLRGTLFRNGPGNFGAPPQPTDPSAPA